MGTHADKEREIKSSPVNTMRQQNGGESGIRLTDNRPQTLLQQRERIDAGDSRAPIQRYIYLNRRTAPLSRASRREAQGIAERIAPQRVVQIMEVYDGWIRDRVSTDRRFDSIEAAVRAINHQLPPLENSAPRESRSESEPRQPPTEERRQPSGVNPTGQTDERQIPEQTVEQERRLEPQPSVIGDERSGNSEPRLDRERERESVAEQNPQLDLNTETRTRVGFEIEVGGHYMFPLRAAQTLNRLVNQTLYECVVDDMVILEMLLDDIQVNERQRQVVAQVEFRTTPQDFETINQDFGNLVRRAISAFQSAWLTGAASHNFPVESGLNPRRGTWRPTELLRNYARALRGATSDSFRFSASGPLAQHATTSIELEAFGQLDRQQQALLYPQGVGARNKQQLLNLLAGRLSGGGNRLIDATTRGRNTELTTIKSPLESIVAADPELQIPDRLPSSGRVTVGRDGTHDLGDPQQVIEEIRQRGTFPQIQGQHGRGYRAVAEKLQAPLRDEVSGQPRVLVEHRGEGLVAAVNAALNGDDSALRRIMRAAMAMDEARVARSSISLESGNERGGNLENSPSEEELENSGQREEPQQIAFPDAIAPPPVHNLNAANMAIHYFAAIQWANAQGTYSDEFHFVRDHPDQARQLLENAGMAPGAAQTFTDEFANEIVQHPGSEAGYVNAEEQEAILNQLGSGEQLLAILRYLMQGQN